MKIHILMSVDPPQFGTTLEAICGAKVPSAVPISVAAPSGFDDGSVEPSSAIAFCKYCRQKSRYFLSLITSGEEVKQMENES